MSRVDRICCVVAYTVTVALTIGVVCFLGWGWIHRPTMAFNPNGERMEGVIEERLMVQYACNGTVMYEAQQGTGDILTQTQVFMLHFNSQ